MEWEWRSHQTMIPTLLKTIYLNYSIINKIIINWMACRTMPNVITIKFECDRSSVSCCQCSMSAYCPSVLKIFFSLLLVHLNFKAILYRILCNQKRMQSTVEYDQTLNVFRIFIGVQVSLHVRAHNNSLVRMCWLLWNCVFFVSSIVFVIIFVFVVVVVSFHFSCHRAKPFWMDVSRPVME